MWSDGVYINTSPASSARDKCIYGKHFSGAEKVFLNTSQASPAPRYQISIYI